MRRRAEDPIASVTLMTSFFVVESFHVALKLPARSDLFSTLGALLAPLVNVFDMSVENALACKDLVASFAFDYGRVVCPLVNSQLWQSFEVCRT